MSSSKTRSVLLLGAGVIAGLALAVGWRASEVRAQGSGCGQWEVMVEVDQVSVNGTRQDYGKPMVRKVTAGWEPFAVGQAGLLMNRRCAR